MAIGIIKNQKISFVDINMALLLDELDRREKEEVERLRVFIKGVQAVEEEAQRRFVKLTGGRCL